MIVWPRFWIGSQKRATSRWEAETSTTTDRIFT